MISLQFHSYPTMLQFETYEGIRATDRSSVATQIVEVGRLGSPIKSLPPSYFRWRIGGAMIIRVHISEFLKVARRTPSSGDIPVTNAYPCVVGGDKFVRDP